MRCLLTIYTKLLIHGNFYVFSQEPAAEEIGVWESVIGKRPINKLIIMAEPDEINRVRPYVESKIGSDGHLTQAQGNMLEVLPPGASKGLGVRHFLDYMKIPSDNVLAIGDAENVRYL